MKKRKLKGFVLPTLYLLITISTFFGIVIFSKDFSVANKDYDYSTPVLEEEEKITPVIYEEDNTILSPVDEEVKVSIDYYNRESDPESQKNSLIYFENTYLPNTGLLYANDSTYEVKSLYNGKVIDIYDDEFFGKVVVIEHKDSLKSYYYGLTDIKVSKEEEVSSGYVLGMSNQNKIMNDKYTFLLEVYYNNKLINPNSFINTKITDYE